MGARLMLEATTREVSTGQWAKAGPWTANCSLDYSGCRHTVSTGTTLLFSFFIRGHHTCGNDTALSFWYSFHRSHQLHTPSATYVRASPAGAERIIIHRPTELYELSA